MFRFLRKLGAPLAGVLIALSMLSGTASAADPEVFEFPSASSTVVASIEGDLPGGEPGGEYGLFCCAMYGQQISQTFTTSCEYLAGFFIELTFTRVGLFNGAHVDWEVLVNGVVVGSPIVITDPLGDQLNVYSAGMGTTTPLIPGPEYEVVLRVTNNVPDNDGSIAVVFSGDMTHDVGFYCAEPQIPDACAGMTFDRTIYGTSGNDTIVGTGLRELIFGLGGNDTISGGAGNDCIVGGLGNDTISGGAGNDKLFGDLGRDTLNGDSGIDFANGGLGNNDTCNAESEVACEI